MLSDHVDVGGRSTDVRLLQYLVFRWLLPALEGPGSRRSDRLYSVQCEQGEMDCPFLISTMGCSHLWGTFLSIWSSFSSISWLSWGGLGVVRHVLDLA